MFIFVLIAPVVTCVSLLLVYTIYVFILHRQYAHIPTPKGAWFYFGHLPALISALRKGTMFWDVLQMWIDECGPTLVWWRLHTSQIIMIDPEGIKELALSKYPKPKLQIFVEVWNKQRFLGQSLGTVQDYDKWKEQRRAFDPSFGRNYLQSLVPHFNEVTIQTLIDPLRSFSDGQTVVDMKKHISKTTLQVISWVGFGTDFNKDPFVQSLIGDNDLLFLLSNTMEGINLHNRNPFIPYLKPFLTSKYTTTARQLRDIGRHCIEERIKAIENKQEVPQDILTNILSLIHTKQDKVSLEDLIDEFVNFYFAGQETTATLLSFTLIHLLLHPDVLNRVVSEIDEVLEGKESVSSGDLDKLAYTTAVLEETLRLYPPAPIVKSSGIEGATICGYRIPKGTFILVPTYNAHRNPDIYPDPLMFDPSRFESDQKRPSPYVYFPFGFGHRSCIGRVFAMMEAKIILALLLHEFTLSLPDNYQFKLGIDVLVQPAEVPCILTQRKN